MRTERCTALRFLCIWVPLFCAALPLAGQNNSIYVTPVTGSSNRPGDNAYIRNVLVREVSARDLPLAQDRQQADYLLIGTLMPQAMYDIFSEGSTKNDSSREYVLHLVLQDNNTGKIRSEQDLLYGTLEEVDNYFPIIAFNMFAGLVSVQTGQKEPEDDPWRNKVVYMGAGVSLNPRVNYDNEQANFQVNFGLDLLMEFHFPKYFSFETGFELAPEPHPMLAVPFSLKLVLKPPSSYFMLEPYGGIHFNIPLSDNIPTSVISWRAGFQYGVKAGSGAVIVNTRFSMNIDQTGLVASGNETAPYQRHFFHLSVGYKYGVGP